MASSIISPPNQNKFRKNEKLKQNANETNSTIGTTQNNFSYQFKLEKSHKSHLEEIQNVRSFQRDNFLIRESYNKIRKIKKELLNSTHKDTLKEALEKKLNFNSTCKSSSVISHEQKEIQPSNNVSSKNNVSNYFPYCTSRIESKEFPKITKDSLDDFLSKLVIIRKQKIQKEIQVEQVERLEEIYVNIYDRIQDDINNSKRNEELLNEWNGQFIQYLKFLYTRKEFEKNELGELYSYRNRLELEIKGLKGKIVKLQKKLEDIILVRNFLICVKEKRKTLPKAFNFFANENEDIYVKTETFITTRSSNASSVKSSRRIAKEFRKSEFDIPDEEKKEMTRLLSYLNSSTIFGSAKEFRNAIEKLEKDNIKLLHKYESSVCTVNQLTKENEILKNLNNLNKGSSYSALKEKEFQLQTIKNKYNSLLKEKENLLNPKKEDNQLALSNKIIYDEAMKIVHTLKTSGINFNLNSLNELKTSIKGDLTILKIINCLKDVEKGLNFLLEKYKSYNCQFGTKGNKSIKPSSNNAKSLTNIELMIEKERIRKKGEELKLKISFKREQLDQEVSKRVNKIYILPKRKLGERCRPKENLEKVNTSFNKDSDELFRELVDYD